MGFDPSTDVAPRILAKGEGRLAFSIMNIAQSNRIQIINDPDLNNLVSQLPVGSEIPENLYTVMAHIFGMVMRMRHEALPDSQ